MDPNEHIPLIGDRPADNEVLQFNATKGYWEYVSVDTLITGADHGLLTGLGDDDHSQYTLVSELASTSTGQGASLVGIEDVAGTLIATDVEAALAELSVPSIPFMPIAGGEFDGDVTFAANISLVVGHTAQVNVGAIPEFQVMGTSISTSAAVLGHWSATTQPPTLYFVKSRNATIGSKTIVQDGDRVGRIRFQVDDGGDFNSTAAEIRVEVDGTPGLNDTPGRMLFCTTPDGTKSAIERIRITEDGTVIVKEKLQLDDNKKILLGTGNDVELYYDATDLIIKPAAGGSGNVKISGGGLRLEDNESVLLGTGGDASILYDGTNLILDPNVLGSGYFRINGNVGINVAPGVALDVNGDINAGTDFYAGGVQGITLADGGDIVIIGSSFTHTLTFRGGILTAYNAA